MFWFYIWLGGGIAVVLAMGYLAGHEGNVTVLPAMEITILRRAFFWPVFFVFVIGGCIGAFVSGLRNQK